MFKLKTENVSVLFSLNKCQIWTRLITEHFFTMTVLLNRIHMASFLPDKAFTTHGFSLTNNLITLK